MASDAADRLTAAVTEIWPHIPISAHISADSSSPECLSQARRWLDNCTTNHCFSAKDGGCPSGSSSPLPTRVISVGDASTDPYLHESAENEMGTWAALSYCWGQNRTLTTTTDTLSERKVGFALDALPKTCRDAVIVARALGIPYIWIDSLCIIQDSRWDWEKEASRMCYVYESALVTFAALHSPSSDSGLFLQGPYRRTVRLETEVTGEPVAVYVRRGMDAGILGFIHGHWNDPHHLNKGSGVLETRAWTLQEITLSPRILWFTSSELGWSCWTSTACECEPEQVSDWIEADKDYLKITSRALLNQDMGLDCPAIWRNVVQNFTSRDLTVPTDRLPAVSGLASALHEGDRGCYLAGLWESEISNQLLWAASDEDHSITPLEDGYAPSWSWASISGPVRFVPEAQRPRFKLEWRVISVQFRTLGIDPFGRGEGSIIIEGLLLPVRYVEGTLVWNRSTEGEDERDTILLCDEHEFLIDSRPRNPDRKALANKSLCFLVAGLLWKGSKNSELDVPILCNGLLLEDASVKGVTTRVGFAEPHFDESTPNNTWAIWEQRCVKTKVKIV